MLLEDFPAEIVLNEGEPFQIPVAYRPCDVDVQWKFNGGSLPEDLLEDYAMLDLTTGDGKRAEVRCDYKLRREKKITV